MSSIGELLRQERLRRGIDLYRIAEQTKINASLLEAIETDNLDKLPGAFFVRSFVRQYSRALGLDENEIEGELARLASAEPPPAEAQPEGPRIELPRISSGGGQFSGQRSLGSLVAFILIVAACSAIYVLWQRTREAPGAASPGLAAAVRQPAGQPKVAPANYSQPPANRPAAEAAHSPAVPAPAAPPAQSAAAPAQAAPEAAPSAAQPAPALSAVPPGQTAAIHVQLRASAPAWVRVIADGRNLFTGTLQPDQARTFEGARALSVRAGNAGGLEVSWNGKALGPVGPKGQIRTLEFTPEAYKILSPAPPAPQPDAPAPKPPSPLDP